MRPLTLLKAISIVLVSQVECAASVSDFVVGTTKIEHIECCTKPCSKTFSWWTTPRNACVTSRPRVGVTLKSATNNSNSQIRFQLITGNSSILCGSSCSVGVSGASPISIRLNVLCPTCWLVAQFSLSCEQQHIQRKLLSGSFCSRTQFANVSHGYHDFYFTTPSSGISFSISTCGSDVQDTYIIIYQLGYSSQYFSCSYCWSCGYQASATFALTSTSFTSSSQYLTYSTRYYARIGKNTPNAVSEQIRLTTRCTTMPPTHRPTSGPTVCLQTGSGYVSPRSYRDFYFKTPSAGSYFSVSTCGSAARSTYMKIYRAGYSSTYYACDNCHESCGSQDARAFRLSSQVYENSYSYLTTSTLYYARIYNYDSTTKKISLTSSCTRISTSPTRRPTPTPTRRPTSSPVPTSRPTSRPTRCLSATQTASVSPLRFHDFYFTTPSSGSYFSVSTCGSVSLDTRMQIYQSGSSNVYYSCNNCYESCGRQDARTFMLTWSNYSRSSYYLRYSALYYARVQIGESSPQQVRFTSSCYRITTASPTAVPAPTNILRTDCYSSYHGPSSPSSFYTFNFTTPYFGRNFSISTCESSASNASMQIYRVGFPTVYYSCKNCYQSCKNRDARTFALSPHIYSNSSYYLTYGTTYVVLIHGDGTLNKNSITATLRCAQTTCGTVKTAYLEAGQLWSFSFYTPININTSFYLVFCDDTHFSGSMELYSVGSSAVPPYWHCNGYCPCRKRWRMSVHSYVYNNTHLKTNSQWNLTIRSHKNENFVVKTQCIAPEGTSLRVSKLSVVEIVALCLVPICCCMIVVYLWRKCRSGGEQEANGGNNVAMAPFLG